ncbi:MAG: hypothetical protein E7632_03805 [Ruminococcaceae bacterium]|nr:hypothetical protein [Oscillospiraceae bacterium]
MKQLSLSGQCRLRFYDEEARRRGMPSPETEIEAVIPGNVELDLMRSGILPELYQANNIKLARAYEFYHWHYTLKFRMPELSAGQHAFLHFLGVDCIADYSLNGEKFAHTENALIDHRFPMPDSVRIGENTLEIDIASPLIFAEAQPNDAFEWAYHINYESLTVRKAPSQYGWDIMPRLVSAGIWKDVMLEIEDANEIAELYLATVDANSASAKLGCSFRLRTDVPYHDGLILRLTGSLDGVRAFRYDHTVRFPNGNFFFRVENPALWWPRGYGDAPIYEIKAELICGEEVLADYQTTFGIRTVKLVHSEISDEYDGDFHFEINGQKIFCRGSNWVPADALHSRSASRYEKMLELFADSGCNILRCWGGNCYEGDEFFDRCDRLGIMVWQDFAMACAFYPQTDSFAEAMKAEAEATAKRLRRHPSLILWSGDNECDAHLWSIAKHDPDKNRITRDVLPEVLRRVDPFRPYLPSSPYATMRTIKQADRLKSTPYSETWVSAEPYKPLLPEDHPWGSRDYFKSPYYRNLRCPFISEIGYHGSCDRESMESFLSPDKLWPWQGNDEWITHAAEMYGEAGPYAYRIPLMARQIYQLFGSQPDNLEDYIFMSQVSQAEADKYFIESSRQLKWTRSGIIWWNMIDGWPQFSDAVVSWDYHKKLAYYYIRQSQQNVMLSFDEPRDWSIRLYAANDTFEEQNITYRVTDGDSGALLLHGQTRVPSNSTIGVNGIDIAWSEKRLLLIEWEANGIRGVNHYIHGTPAFALNDMKRWVKTIAGFISRDDMYETISRIIKE